MKILKKKDLFQLRLETDTFWKKDPTYRQTQNIYENTLFLLLNYKSLLTSIWRHVKNKTDKKMWIRHFWLLKRDYTLHTCIIWNIEGSALQHRKSARHTQN